MKTLTLTSPLTTGSDVTAAQRHLKTNVFKQDYLRAAVDGVFGPATSRACVRAKYWLGYDDDALDPIYGDLLDGYLTGRVKLPARLAARRTARVKAAASPPPLSLGENAVKQLQPFVGTTESPPGTNIHPLSTWYGMRGPWCAMAITYGYVRAGSKAFVKGSRYAYVPFMVIDAKAGRNGLVLISYKDAKAGDIVCFDWQKGGPLASPYAFDHAGLLRSKVNSDGVFKSREGNTSDDWTGSQSNGGGLYDRDDRDMDRATCVFIRVGR